MVAALGTGIVGLLFVLVMAKAERDAMPNFYVVGAVILLLCIGPVMRLLVRVLARRGS